MKMSMIAHKRFGNTAYVPEERQLSAGAQKVLFVDATKRALCPVARGRTRLMLGVGSSSASTQGW